MKTDNEHDEPSAESLREMPEVEFRGGGERGRHFKKALPKGGYSIPDGEGGRKWVPLKRGRPKKGEETEGTISASIRIQPSLWERLDVVAKEENTTRNELVVRALVGAANAAMHEHVVIEETTQADEELLDDVMDVLMEELEALEKFEAVRTKAGPLRQRLARLRRVS
jgi:hypothetical protein